MAVFVILPLILLIQPYIFSFAFATTIEIRSQVSYTVWSSFGSEHHAVDQSWTVNAVPIAAMAPIRSCSGHNSCGRGQGSYPMSGGDGRYRRQGHNKPSKVVVDLMVSKPEYHELSSMDGLNFPLEFSPTTDGVPTSYVGPDASTVYAYAPSSRKKSDTNMPAAVQRMIRQNQMPAVWF